MKKTAKKFTLDELCVLVEINKRKVRYYIQHELVDRPEGSGGKGAFYTHRHLEQLLSVKKWKDAGLSLERIKEITGSYADPHKISESDSPIPPPRPRQSGSIEVWSHLLIADGLELHIEPRRSGLTPEKIRDLCREVLDQYEKTRIEDD